MKRKIIFFISSTLFFISQACFAQGITWTGPKIISDSILDISNTYGVLNNQGQAVCIWLENDRGSSLMTTYSTDGGNTWATPFLLSDVFDLNVALNDKNCIAINDNGEVLVVYNLIGTEEFKIKRSSDGGQTWNTTLDTTFSSHTFFTAFPRIRINNNSEAICIWLTDITGNNEIFYSTSTDGGQTWAQNPPVTTTITGCSSTSGPELELNNNGNVICAWTLETPGNTECSTFSFTTPSWSHPITIHQATPPVFHTDQSLSLSFNDNGTAIATIQRNQSAAPQSAGICSVFSTDNGTNWSPALGSQLVISSGLFKTNGSLVKINNNGHAVCLFLVEQATDGGPVLNEIYSTYNLDNTYLNWSTPVSLSPGNPAEPTFKFQLSTLTNSGQLIATWLSSTQPDLNVYFTSNGGISWPSKTIVPFNFAPREAYPLLNTYVILNGTSDGFIYDAEVLNGTIVNNTVTFETSKKQINLLLQKDIVDELKWTPIEDASGYRLYLDSDLTNMIYNGTNPYFNKHGSSVSKTTYYFTFLDAGGVESSPITITVE